MTRTYNVPKRGCDGARETHPEYRKTIKGSYTPPATCGRYCGVDRAPGSRARLPV
jgi:hypothetical protein